MRVLRLSIRRRIRNFFGGLLGLILRSFGFAHKARKRIFLNRYITAICFHHPNSRLFEKCIKWLLKNKYKFISAKRLVSVLSKETVLGEGLVWISFDDGWKDNMQNVIPVIKKYKIPATFFIVTHAVKNAGVFWPSIVDEFREHLPEDYRKNVRLLWKAPEHERKKVIDGLVEKFSDYLHREAMTVEDVKSIANIEHVEIGSHTANHVITPNCTEEELESEVETSKREIEKWTGRPVDVFSYPNGDFDGREKDVLKKHGFNLAVTLKDKPVTLNDDPYYLPRFSSINDGFFSEAVCHMVGIWNFPISSVKNFLSRIIPNLSEYFSKRGM